MQLAKQRLPRRFRPAVTPVQDPTQSRTASSAVLAELLQLVDRDRFGVESSVDDDHQVQVREISRTGEQCLGGAVHPETIKRLGGLRGAMAAHRKAAPAGTRLGPVHRNEHREVVGQRRQPPPVLVRPGQVCDPGRAGQGRLHRGGGDAPSLEVHGATMSLGRVRCRGRPGNLWMMRPSLGLCAESGQSTAENPVTGVTG